MRAASEGAVLERKLDAGGWGLFFVWIGIAMAMNVGWGVGLLGVGAITMGVQVARKIVGLRLDRFSVAIGALFLAGGIWKLLDVTVELVPVLCIVAGIALLASALAGPRASRHRIGPQTPAPHLPG